MRSFLFWHSDDEEIEGQAWKGNGYTDQRVDGITIKWNSHQEDGAEAEDNGEKKAELKTKGKIRLDNSGPK